MSKYTEAQARAVKKYLGNIGETKVRAPKEDMEKYKEKADQAGLSLNQFFVNAAEEKIRREKSV